MSNQGNDRRGDGQRGGPTGLDQLGDMGQQVGAGQQPERKSHDVDRADPKGGERAGRDNRAGDPDRKAEAGREGREGGEPSRR